MEPTQVLIPGMLVALRTSVSGGVQYDRRDLEEDAKFKKWETTRKMVDPDEHAAAVRMRSEVIRSVSNLCARTEFGLLCRQDKEAELDGVIEALRDKVRGFNATAKCTRVAFYAVKGHIADTDEEALRAIVDEAGELLKRMDAGISSADPKVIRDAAAKARALQDMFVGDTATKISEAVAAARNAAKEIVRRVQKNGERATEVIDDLDRKAFDAARFAFLDVQTEIEALPAVNLQRAAELELEV